MPEITEKRSFRVPPSKIDKELFSEIGKVLEDQSLKLYQSFLDQTVDEIEESFPKSMSASDKEKIVEELMEMRKDRYTTKYDLTSPSKDIESQEIEEFVNTKWPSDSASISVRLGGTLSPLKVNIDLNLEPSEMNKSRISVLGRDATVVHGLSDQLAKSFEEKKLGYHIIVEYWPIRIGLSALIIAFILLTASLFFPQIWQVEAQYLAFLSFLGILVLDTPLKWIFPRLEFGENPKPKRLRKWILGLITGSGIISGIIFRLLGLE